MHRVAFLLALLVPAMSAGQAPAVRENRFVGGWVMDVSKSRLSPKLPIDSATLQIAVSGNTISMSGTMVIAGKEIKRAETFRSDGTETPATITGITLAAQWVGPSVLATVGMKGDQLLALDTYEVSADGKTLTVRTSGSIEHVLVMDRR